MPSAIEVRGLSKHFGPVQAVSDLSFEVNAGRVTGFLGPNGSGKTTTLRILLGLVGANQGTATFGGRRYADLDRPVHRVGAVLEATSFHPGRRAEDHLRSVALPAGIPRKRVRETLELVGLGDEGRRRVGKFSLGMRQRLQLATALLGDPEVLILDEPANGLDPQGIQWLRTFIRYQASNGHAVLVSSHLLSEMQETVDDVIIVSHGKLVLEAPLADLAKQGGTSSGLQIRTPELDRLASLLAAVPAGYRQTGPDTMIIDGATPEWFGPFAAQHQIVLYELTPTGDTLEDVFLRLTHGFDAADPGQMGEPAGEAVVIAIVRGEWLKLRTTAVPWVMSVIAILINGLLILGIFLTQEGTTTSSGGGGGGGPFGGGGSSSGPGPTIQGAGFEIPHTTQQLRNLVGSGLPIYILALLLGVLMITTEFRHKTVTTAFLVTPRRPRLVAGKLITAAIVGAGLAVVVLAATVIGGGLTLVARGGSFSAMVHQLPVVAPGMILVFALFAVLGVGVGSFITNQVAAIVVVLGWFIILEGILVALVHSAERWVPSGAATAAASVSRGREVSFGLFSWWQGALLVLGYGLAFAVIGSLILTRRDIS